MYDYYPFCMYYCPYGSMEKMICQHRCSLFWGTLNQVDEIKQQPCNGFIYTVRSGDTLYSIAQHYKVSLNNLIKANPQITDPDALIIGQSICVPGVMPLPIPVKCPGKIYTVRYGDTLTSIARRYNVTVSAILATNPVITNPNNIVVGQNICIPSVSPVVYRNYNYGFSFSLPESWRGYKIVASGWEGRDISGRVIQTGPEIIIRHPLWTVEHPRQDIPIMVFTLEQWAQLQQDKFHIGAAPVGPKKLGSNNKYAFALPARYNFGFLEGYEEVERILEGNPLHTINT